MDYFDYDSIRENSGSRDFDIQGFLEESKQREENRLEKELARVKEQLEARDEIHEEVVDELESKIDWYHTRLEQLYKQHRGKNGERQHLKKKIEEFYHELRKEKQRNWRDRQELMGDRRRLLRELKEVDDSFTELLK